MGSFIQKKSFILLLLTGNLFVDLLVSSKIAHAQVIPDDTLPQNTVVTKDGNISEIQQGTRVGDNLFHSFEEFSVFEGSTAFFNLEMINQDVQNIISRVTGNTPSKINGTIKVNNAANLFLINPQGIVFGANAQLDVDGSFLASTANSIQFPDGREFSATNFSTPPLLSINVPIGLQFGSNPAPISNQSTAGLQVNSGQTLALVGGELRFPGGHLTASQGRIELGSVGDNSFVQITPTMNGFTLGYEGVDNFQDINLSQQSVVDVSGEGSGFINIQGGQVNLSQASQILANTTGNRDGGDITIQAEQLNLKEGAFVSASTFGDGAAGRLMVNAALVEIIGIRNLQEVLDTLFEEKTITLPELGTGLFSLSFGSGAANSLIINTETLSLQEGGFISTSPFSTGSGGDMMVRASESVELVGSELFADSYGKGDAGQITVQTRQLRASEGGGIFNSTFDAGRGGNVLIQASDSIELMGTTPDGRFKSSIASNAFEDATQATGNVIIETRRLTIQDGAGIGGATLGAAQGGTIKIQASESVELIGTSANGLELSSLNTQSFGKGAAGDIEVYTRRLVLRDGGVISTTTQDAGRAGRVVIRASESVEVSGVSADGKFPSSLRSDASSDSVPSGFIPPPQTEVLGEAGDVTIETGRLIIRDGAEVTVNGEKFAAAGNLRVDADLIWLKNGSRISATTRAGTEGNITLQTQNLLLQNQSQISTNAENANGGNIRIDTGNLVALNNSDISANAQAGAGGRVTVNAFGIFGTQFREALTPESDITATSALGAEFKGIVNINIQAIDPNQGLIRLPENFIEPNNQIVTACDVEQGNSFVVTGRGGLPEDPTQTLRGRTLWQDLRVLALNEEEGDYVETLHVPSGSGASRDVTVESLGDRGESPSERRSPIVEAQGWIINSQGQVELVAHLPDVTPHSSWYKSATCLN
ncbi:MAG: S-layer family protein [Coleofasciculus sp. A1-SPW-01]|uniref:filamentous hemagglutinin N-terminal domain-containing protein n=1 Tax=Coleofasciculus sp. A1-SPW-01 TaxID=3070819 RepID=UPI0032FDDCDA